MDISPGFYRYRMQLQHESARVLFANTINLLPGTLSAEILGIIVVVHSLNVAESVKKELWDLETIIAALFAQELSEEARSIEAEEADD